MNSKERMSAVRRGDRVDRIPFAPTIFEHSACLIGKTPSEAAVDGHLLERAQIKAYEVYGHDLVTAGIDVYNIEAEALGCKIKYHDNFSIPGVISHPFENNINLDDVEFSIDKGRIKLVLDASDRINRRIGSEVNVGIGISGPFSIAVELAGYDNVIFDCINDGENTYSFLGKILEFQKNYSKEIIRRNLGITIFESWAAPPLVSPDIYRRFVLPYESELISFLKSSGAVFVPLVIGGDTTQIVDDIIESGTSVLIADYMVDIGLFIDKASKKDLVVRGNIDPKLVERGSKEDVIRCTGEMLKKAKGCDKFILGTGVIPYNTPKDNIIAIKEYLYNMG